MEEGKIVSWSKGVGDPITAGDILAEIETDKAVVPFESTDDGFIAKLLVESGVRLKVGTPIAVITNSKEAIPEFVNYTPEKPGQTSSVGSEKSTASATGTNTTILSSTATSSQQNDNSTRIFASPKARVAAKEKGIDLGSVPGTGPNGRIIFADVEEFVPATKTEPTTKPVPAVPSTFVDIPTSNIRKVIASRLLHSKQNIPHYYLTMECNVDNLLELRKTLNDLANGQYKLSVNDFVIKAAALALKAVPEVNSEWREDHIRQYQNIDINVAVNTDRGLLTPLIRDCDKIGLATISNLVKETAGRAQRGQSTPNDLLIGTFTISNLGMFGIRQFCAVINPPQAGILAVGSIEKKVVLVGGGAGGVDIPQKFANVNILTVTVSCDHRVVDGAVGAKWLQHFKDVIENPIKFLL
eukprot:TRINITY_DN66_c0_g1_i4.p1 TRINITY_DN66_c0_g1~~TRINITY_DN66_c0_g1_i4.p1  ORF type:complete len:412 (-),score=94.65 TRINITY_DN66_c0_g1_i4:88-1323(-)